VQPEIVDLHEEPYSVAAGAALRAIRIELPEAKVCIYTAQNLLARRYPPPFSWIEQRVLTAAGAAYPCSIEAGDRLRRQGFRGAIHVLPLGVSLPAAVDREPGVVRVGFVGRLEPYKGGLIAVRAFLEAAARATAEASLEVIGNGSQAEAMRREVENSGTADQVVFTGALPQDETLRRIAKMDVMLIPSLTTPTWKEQFGRVAVQAMAAGAVVIASDSGSLREVVGDSGVLVPEGDEEALAAALQALLDDPVGLATLRDSGRRRAAERFSWEAVAAGADRMYRELGAADCNGPKV
jgi:glycosyltransferase involved in cell wall biosynthesis